MQSGPLSPVGMGPSLSVWRTLSLQTLFYPACLLGVKGKGPAGSGLVIVTVHLAQDALPLALFLPGPGIHWKIDVGPWVNPVGSEPITLSHRYSPRPILLDTVLRTRELK